MRLYALQIIHDSPMSGHMGRDRTWERARKSFWGPRMKADVHAHVSKCEACGSNKRSKHPGKAPFQNRKLPEYMNEQVQVDFMGPFPISSSHPYRYILQMQDILTRYVVLVSLEDCSAKIAVDTLVERWICMFGVPRVITSERGSHFTADNLFGIKQDFGSPYHPRKTITDEVKIRHFDELEQAPVSKYSWETALADHSDEEVIRIESGTGSNSEGIRRSTRERHLPSRLQVDPSKRSYESEEEEFWDECSNSENELEDDQNCL
ncbi:uncharacterized protein LOC135219072 [Macrobrachium nipponense]|uniref:uncharacterized protein LOC135219072 n=1 Tax=Macrobrachium nipponense TaxID=159736 RepID=UPI0030C8A3F4